MYVPDAGRVVLRRAGPKTWLGEGFGGGVGADEGGKSVREMLACT